MWLCIGQRRRHCHNCRQWCAAVDKSQSPHGSWFQFNCAFLGSACVLDPSAGRTARCCSRSSSVCCYFIFSLLLAVTTRKREGMWKWQPVRMKLQHLGLLWCQFLLYPPLPVVLTLCSLHHIGNARITLEIIVYQEPCSVGSIRLSPKDQCVLCWMNSRLATGARDDPCCFSSIIVPSSVWGTAPCAGEHGRLLLSHRECWRAGSVQNWWSAWWSDIKNSMQEPPCAAALSSGSTLCRGIYIIRPVLAVTQLSQPNFMFVKAFGEWALDREQHKYLEWLTFMYCCFFIITRTPGRPSSGDGKSWQKVHSLELLVFCVFFSPPTAVKIIDLWDKWQEHS